MKKTRLQIEYDYDFFLLGIVTSVKEFKLAWHLNSALTIDLSKQEDILIPKIDDGDLIISNLVYETNSSKLRLISNRSAEGDDERKSCLLPELQNFTHFLVLEDEGEVFDQKELAQKVKSIEVVEYAVVIEPEKLKNKDNLIF